MPEKWKASPEIREKSADEIKGQQVKQYLLEILGDRRDVVAQRAREALGRLGPAAVREAIRQAADFVSADNRIGQYLLGGEFVAEAGQRQNRRVLSLSADELIKEHPYLDLLCLKSVPPEARFDRELGIHEAIQAAAAKTKGDVLSIPLVLDRIEKEGRVIGAIMERLPKGEHDNTLQTFMAEAKRHGVVVRLSGALAAKIEAAYHELHRLGFAHGDINEGNVYLLNADVETRRLPKEPGKRRPELEMIFDADVKLVDFEKANRLGRSDRPETSPEAAAEDREVEAMLRETSLDADPDTDLEEVAELSDNLFEEQKKRELEKKMRGGQ